MERRYSSMEPVFTTTMEYWEQALSTMLKYERYVR
jgi:hypothetical protein